MVVATYAGALASCNSVSCRPTPGRRNGGETVSPSPLRVDWKPHTLTTGVSLTIPDETTLVHRGDAHQGTLVSGFRPVRVGAWYGPGNDLAAWRSGILSRPGATAGAETRTTVCGQPARRLEIETPDRLPDHLTLTTGESGFAENPGETFVAVALDHHGGPVVAFYVVTTAQRSTYAGDEAHFFATIRCR